jgi:succinate dehydrogenase/fumarate reductase cytochrome b subunit
MSIRSFLEWVLFFGVTLGVLCHAAYCIYVKEVDIRAFHYLFDKEPMKFSMVVGAEIIISTYLILARVFKIDLLKRFDSDENQ